MIEPRIWQFPTFPISKQLFSVPGLAVEGGVTAGGARITSPEPGGFSLLQIQPSMQVREWDFPISSWLASKTNGQIFRVRLAPTPQCLSSRAPGVPWAPETLWNNDQPWSGDYSAAYAAPALEGTGVVVINMAGVPRQLKPGHVIGHGGSTYKVDEISYDGDIATIAILPPLRRDIKQNDPVFFRPYFTGTINSGDFKNTYDAENVGNIQLGMITLNESII